MEIDEIEEKLKSVEKIEFSRHFQIKSVIRTVSQEEILETLKSLEFLEFAEDQGEEYGARKFALLFHKSSKYDLKIVISIKDKALNVVTAHIQNKKRRKVFEKWLNQRK